MKKLLNSKERMVDDMIDGFVAAYPSLVARGENPRVVRRAKPADADKKVTLAIGNGSGHEPIAMGFVGEGMLDANIVGEVFTAPPADLILEGIKEINGKAGTLLLISRHEGDVINGEWAVEMATEEGMDARRILMYDDISSAPKGEEGDRRGAAGTLFIYKILGAAAEEGMDLDALERLGAEVRDSTRTLGAAVKAGVSPITGKEMFELPDDEIYIGMGVHGEPGVSSRKVGPVSELVAFMLGELLADRPIEEGGRAAVLVNGSGATTMMELLTVYREVEAGLAEKGVKAVAPLVGSLSTTQDTSGFSVSLLVPTDEMLRLWTAPQSTPLFPAVFE